MHRLAIWYELIETKPAMTNVRFQDEHAALFGLLRGILTTSWRGSWETSRLKLARLNVRIFASVRAGAKFFSHFWDVDFSWFKVFLSIRHLWSSDKGVSTKWGGQVRPGREKERHWKEKSAFHEKINDSFLNWASAFRFSQPGAYRVKQGSDYLENQCESRKHRCVTLQVSHLSDKLTCCKIPIFLGQTRCEYTPQTRDQYLIYTDKSLQAFSDSSCRQACTQVGHIDFAACFFYILYIIITQ